MTYGLGNGWPLVVIVRLVLIRKRWRVILAVVYLISSVVLVIKMASPMNIRITYQGEHEVYEREVSNVYTFTDVVTIATAAAGMSSSVLTLVQTSRATPEFKIENSALILKTLGESEKKIYELVLEKGGVASQTEVVETSGMSKSVVSITLDRLEARGLIEKRKRGMSNVIIARPMAPANE